MTNQIKNIGQISIAVGGIKQAKDFYQNILQLSFLFDAPPNLAFFDCGGVRLMLTKQQGQARAHKTSVIYYRVADIDLATQRLLDKGITFIQTPQLTAKMPDHELWMGLIRDPDENLIGIMSEKPLACE